MRFGTIQNILLTFLQIKIIKSFHCLPWRLFNSFWFRVMFVVFRLPGIVSSSCFLFLSFVMSCVRKIREWMAVRHRRTSIEFPTAKLLVQRVLILSNRSSHVCIIMSFLDSRASSRRGQSKVSCLFSVCLHSNLKCYSMIDKEYFYGFATCLYTLLFIVA